MRIFTKYSAIVAFLLVIVLSNFAFSAESENDAKAREKINKVLGAGNQNSLGREFYIAFPPNDLANTSQEALDVYIGSSVKTEVVFSNEALGIEQRYTVEPFEILALKSSNRGGPISWGWEVRESEIPLDLGFKITAKDPISVYVINCRNVTADGYLAVPVSAWGKKYIHVSYYDHYEGGSYSVWPNGFIAIASQDNTKLVIKLKGKGDGYGTTRHGKKLGQTITVNLQQGQVYAVEGEGLTSGVYDLTGTEITANKNIGLISYHTRTPIPQGAGANRDNLIEMMPPVQAWGKKYATVEYMREKGLGDYFRAVASEANTLLKVNWFDKGTQALVGSSEKLISNPGEYVEFFLTSSVWPNNKPGINGTSTWEFDKPGCVMQYSYSSNWDNNYAYDPFMCLVVPEEQFTKGTLFLTPQKGVNEFTLNYFNIFAVGDTSDVVNNNRLLESIYMFNGNNPNNKKRIIDLDSKFQGNNIPGTNIYWATIQCSPGSHTILSETPFGGHVYGFSSVQSYGWPAATAYRSLGVTDTLAPEPSYTYECGEYEVKVKEERFGKPEDNPRQTDMAVALEPTFMSETFNFKEEIEMSPKWIPGDSNALFSFKVSVEDKYKDAHALIYLVDRNNNDTTVSLWYEVDSLEIKDPIDFGHVRVQQTKQLKLTLYSQSDSTITIKKLKTKLGQVFKVISPTPELVLAPRKSLEVVLEYTPKIEYIYNGGAQMDIDSLQIETSCLYWAWEIKGKGVVPKIWVGDFDAGSVNINATLCKAQDQGQGLQIKNVGTDTLEVTGVSMNATAQLPFTFTPKNFTFPFKLSPGDSKLLSDVCYSPLVSGIDERNVPFVSDAMSLPEDKVIQKPISNWKGNAALGLLNITNERWGQQRVGTVNNINGIINKGKLYITNTGDKMLYVKANLVFDTPNDPNFKILSPNDFTDGLDIALDFEKSSNPNSKKVIELPVEFTPKSVGAFINKIKIEASDDKGGNITTATGTLTGEGFIPQIKVSEYTFANPTLVGTEHKESDNSVTKGYVTITNVTDPAQAHDLTISSITTDASTNTSDFMEYDASSKWFNGAEIKIPQGDSIRLFVKFKPTQTGNRSMTFNILSDAGPAKGANGEIRDPKDYLNTDGKVFGIGRNSGEGTTNIDFKNRLACDYPVDSIAIINSSTTDAFTINSITPNGDFAKFTRLGTIPTVVNPSQTVYIKYQFETSIPGTYKATYEVDYDTKDTKNKKMTYEIKGVAYKVGFNYSLNSYPNAQPGSVIDYPITLKTTGSFNTTDYSKDASVSPGIFSDANITNFEIGLRYKTIWLSATGIADKLATNGEILDNTWTLTTSIEKDINNADYSILKIIGTGTNAINKSGVIANLKLLMLLSQEEKFSPNVDLASVKYGVNGVNNACIVSTETPAEIAYVICSQNLRNVTLGQTMYSLQEISPNPVTNNGKIDVNFGIGIEAETTMRIISTTGTVIETPINNVMKTGEYQMQIDTSKLPSGKYMINLESGPFNKTIDLIIAK